MYKEELPRINRQTGNFHGSDNTLLRTLLGAFRACPAPRRVTARRDASPYRSSEVLPLPCGGHAGRVTLPRFRAGGGYSVPLFTAQSRHKEPYPPMSKINPTFPFTIPFKGNAEKYTPFPRQKQAGIFRKLKLEIVRRLKD